MVRYGQRVQLAVGHLRADRVAGVAGWRGKVAEPPGQKRWDAVGVMELVGRSPTERLTASILGGMSVLPGRREGMVLSFEAPVREWTRPRTASGGR
jgi:hypothetical protein